MPQTAAEQPLVQGNEHWAHKGDIKLFLWEKKHVPGTARKGTILFIHGSSWCGQPTFDLHVPGRPFSSVMDWFAARGYDTVDAIRKLGPRLKIVHLKDVKAAGNGDNVVLGTGIAKIAEVERELRRQNFPYLAAIEYDQEGNDDVTAIMRENMNYAVDHSH